VVRGRLRPWNKMVLWTNILPFLISWYPCLWLSICQIYYNRKLGSRLVVFKRVIKPEKRISL